MNLKYTIENQIFKNEGAVYSFVLLLFLLFPFITFLGAIIKFKSKYSHFIFVLFTTLFGYNMVAESEGLDLFRMHEMLQVYSPYSISQIGESFINTWTNKGESIVQSNNNADIYESIVSLFVSRFTDNGKVLMAVFGFFYGLVFVNVLRKFTNKITNDSLFVVLLILFATMMMPLNQLAGVRYGTATYIFVLAVINFIQNTEIRNRYVHLVLLCIVSCLIHFSFVLPSFLLIVFVLVFINFDIRKLLNVLYFIYIISFFFPNLISLILPNDIQNLFGDGIAARTAVYSDKDTNLVAKNDYFRNSSWYIVYPYMFSTWVIKIGVFLWLFYRFKIIHNNNLLNLLSVVLLLLIVVNFSGDISNLGPRLIMVSGILFYYYLFELYLLNFSNRILKNILIIISLLMFLKIILEIRFTIQYTSLIFYYGSVFHIFADTSNTSLWTNLQIWYQKIAYYR